MLKNIILLSVFVFSFNLYASVEVKAFKFNGTLYNVSCNEFKRAVDTAKVRRFSGSIEPRLETMCMGYSRVRITMTYASNERNTSSNGIWFKSKRGLIPTFSDCMNFKQVFDAAASDPSNNFSAANCRFNTDTDGVLDIGFYPQK